MREGRFSHVQEASVDAFGADTQELGAGFFNCLRDLKLLYKKTLAQRGKAD